MDSPKEYYEGQELSQLVAATDWVNLLPVLYASTRSMIYKRFLSDPDKGISGKTFKDFVHEAVTLFIEGKRRCPKHIKLEYFFLALTRNLISKQIATHYATLSIDATEEDILQKHYESINITFDIKKVKQIIASKFNQDQISIDVFDCWAEGISKPAEIRELYGYTEPEYNNAKKRLDRVLIDIRKHLQL